MSKKWLTLVAMAGLLGGVAAVGCSSSESGGGTPGAGGSAGTAGKGGGEGGPAGSGGTGGAGGTAGDGGAGKGGSAGDSGTPVTDLGKKCATDADCGGTAGLKCTAVTANGFLGGGPAGGYCTLDCSDFVTGDAAADPCTSFDGVCVNMAANDGDPPAGFCLQSCQQGVVASGTSFSAKVCHARKDVGCTQLYDGNGQPADTVCLPICASDADCGSSGRHCDPRSGACVDNANTGDPTGSHCTPDADAAPTCAGACVSISGNPDAGDPEIVASVCGSRCVIGNQNGCGYDPGGDLPQNYCLFSSAGAGIGDEGFCGQVCDSDSDCFDQADGVWCNTDAQVVAFIGHGYCTWGNEGKPEGGAGGSGGSAGAGGSAGSDAGDEGAAGAGGDTDAGDTDAGDTDAGDDAPAE